MAGAVIEIEAIQPVRVRFRAEGLSYDLKPGQRAELPQPLAVRLLESVPDKVRLVQPPLCPIPPIPSGWHVAWRGPDGRLCGGFPDPAGRVLATHFTPGRGWTLELAGGTRLPLAEVVSVGRTDAQGRLTGAWVVSAMGYDGEGDRA